jgi:hypothetical protein
MTHSPTTSDRLSLAAPLGRELAVQRGLYPVSDAAGQNVRPLGDCVVADPYSSSGSSDRAAEQFNGFLLVHGLIEP